MCFNTWKVGIPAGQLHCASFALRANAGLKQIRIAAHRVLWLMPLRLTSQRALACVKTLRWFFRLQQAKHLSSVSQYLASSIKLKPLERQGGTFGKTQIGKAMVK
ncbi:MAG: hypothetical protein CVU29_10545 [Betaproteobacteria bacterium HGW-Betaproteobacteria-22]|nr:MAG: hypothetical protein CVU29_10545 [Betaproteobacteria bacterium HGW-Betaproteobacteria-22]